MFKQVISNRFRVINLVFLLLIGAVYGRMLPYYLTTSYGPLVLGLLLAYTLLFLTRGVVTRWLGGSYIHLYTTIQMGITLVLMTAVPSFDFPQDFFLILLVPLCMQVMLVLPENQGAAWVAAISMITAAVAIVYFRFNDDSWEGFGYSLAYVSVFTLVSVFTAVTRRSEEEQVRTRSLVAQLQEANIKLEDYSQQVEQYATLEERSRLARELHDSVSQTIFSLTLTTQAARMLLDRDPARVPEQLDRLQVLSKNALAEMRLLIQQNKPAADQSESLPDLLRKHAAERLAMDGLSIHADLRGETRLPVAVESAWFRVAQEALNNIVKHAGVKEAWLTIDLDADPPYLYIEDHGAGFDPSQLKPSAEHMGLEGMRERIHKTGGELTVVSAPGQGTRVRVEGGKEQPMEENHD